MILLLLEVTPFLVSLLLGLPFGPLAPDLAPAQVDVAYRNNLVCCLLGYLLKFCFGYLLLLTYLKNQERPQTFLALRPPQGSDVPVILLGCLGLALLPRLTIFFCKVLLGLKEPEQQQALGKLLPLQGNYSQVSLLIIGVLGPTWEELSSRGFMMRVLTDQKRCSHRLVILFQGVCFGLMHIGYRSTVILLATSMMGMFLGWVRLRYRTTTIPIMMHVLNNVIFFFGICFQK